MNRAFVYAVLTSFIWGLAPAFEKMGLRGKIDPYAGVVIRTVPIAVIGLFGLLFLGKIKEISSADLRSVAFVVAGGLLAGFFGQVAFYSALKAGEASKVVPLAATYPLVALVISVIFLGEELTLQKFAGIGMIVSGVILLR
ncbi:MAG: EamA family transporter [Deltaproteobacteria bacterium]|nr:EamA family transporter [Deltaproteobacteria bacterium]